MSHFIKCKNNVIINIGSQFIRLFHGRPKRSRAKGIHIVKAVEAMKAMEAMKEFITGQKTMFQLPLVISSIKLSS